MAENIHRKNIMTNRKFLYLALFSFLFLFAGNALADSELEASELVDKGLRLLERGETEMAFEAFHKSILLNPNVSKPYVYRGRLYFTKEDWKRAGEDFNMAIKNNSSNMDAYLERGNLYNQSRMYNYAINDYSVLIMRAEFDIKVKALGLRAKAFVEIDNQKGALADYTELIRLEPTGELGYFGRAMVFDNMDDSLNALEDYNRAIEINPLNAEALNRRAEIFEYIGERGKARRDRVAARQILNPVEIEKKEEDPNLPPVPGAEPTGISNAPASMAKEAAAKEEAKAPEAVKPPAAIVPPPSEEPKETKVESPEVMPDEAQSEWTHIAQTTDGTKHSMDIGGIENLTEALRRVRVKKEMGEMKKGYMALYKAALRKRGVDPAKFNYTIVKYEVDCMKNTLRTVGFSDHSEAGDTLYERGSMESSAKTPKPRSMDSIIINYTCK